MMRIGLGMLGLSPGAFWGMTMPEYMARVEGTNQMRTGGTRPASRDELNRMMAENPD